MNCLISRINRERSARHRQRVVKLAETTHCNSEIGVRGTVIWIDRNHPTVGRRSSFRIAEGIMDHAKIKGRRRILRIERKRMVTSFDRLVKSSEIAKAACQIAEDPRI